MSLEWRYKPKSAERDKHHLITMLTDVYDIEGRGTAEVLCTDDGGIIITPLRGSRITSVERQRGGYSAELVRVRDDYVTLVLHGRAYVIHRSPKRKR